MSVKDALEMAKKNKVEIVDLKFIDFPGLWQHFSIPAAELSAELFEEGLGFDGSSIRGFQSINESDMILLPDADTAMMDRSPNTPPSALSATSSTPSPASPTPETRDTFTQKAEKYLKSTGLADTSYWGPEIEFFHLRQRPVRPKTIMRATTILTRSKAFGTSGKGGDQPNLGNKIRYKEGYFPYPPWTSTRI